MFEELLFEELSTGDFFTHMDAEYQKTSTHYRRRYGTVNAKLLENRYYEGDTGHRFIHGDAIISRKK